MFSSNDTVRLPSNERLVELTGARPTWLWVHTCAQPHCDCRSALIVTTDVGREALLEQGAAVREALAAGATQWEVGAKLIDIDHFFLDIDTAKVCWFNGRDEIDVRDHPRLGPIARCIDGELLDEIGRLWHLGKGRPDPEQRVLNAQKVVPRGWKRGDLLAWDELCAGVRRDLYDLGHHLYEAHELYCPIPACTCGKVVIDFEPRSPRGATHPGSVVVSSSDTAAKLEPSKRGQARLEQLWAAFQQRHPQYHPFRGAVRDNQEHRRAVCGAGGSRCFAGGQSGPKRPMPLRIRPEVQEVLRSFPGVAGTSGSVLF